MADEKKPKRYIPKQEIVALDPNAFAMLKKDADKIKDANLKQEEPQEEKSVLGLILKSIKAQNSMQVAQIERMSFEVDPQANYSGNMGFYRLKSNLTPDFVIKKICGPSGDELVNEILQARSNHISSFGRPRTDRFSVGFEFQEMDRNAKRDEKDQEALQQRIDRAKKIMWQCGRGTLDDELDQVNLAQYLKLITRDGLSYGRFATERIWWTNPKTGKRELYAWRASDGGTMYKILPQKEHDQSLRAEAIRQLQQLKNKKIDVEKYKRDEYRYVQVIEGKPRQAFTEEELVVYNLYPATNIEYNGYPLTPIDQALNAIATHINITMHNKLFFQNGRAAKGMLVFKSESVDEAAAQRIRLQFHQSINSVQNSWRMPVFGIGAEDELTWSSIDISGRDAEFQYLMDNNARVILSAFQMSPEELPGYAHLARGTNTQALSESDNEWKLTAARDVGLRPLLSDMQDFLNTHILPEVDAELAKTHQIVLAGLEKDSPEKENTRLQQDMAVHMNYNEVMQQVEKNPVAIELGGDFPLNPQFQAVLDKYVPVGVILENFFGQKGAAKDPRWQYVRDPFYFQSQQMILQKAQLAMQQSMQAQQMMQQQAMAEQGIQTDESGQPIQPGQEGGDEGGGEGGDEGNPKEGDSGDSNPKEGDSNPAPEQTSKAEKAIDKVKEISDKNSQWAAINYSVLEKTIANNHNMISRKLLKRHEEIVNAHMSNWKKESKKAVDDIARALKDKKGG
jgi:hypothetical protein